MSRTVYRSGKQGSEREMRACFAEAGDREAVNQTTRGSRGTMDDDDRNDDLEDAISREGKVVKRKYFYFSPHSLPP